MPPISEEDQRTKMMFIDAFFDEFQKKLDYLEELDISGHHDEARILCSCYVDWLASALYWPDGRTNRNYVKCLSEHGGKEIFSHIHPKMLDDALYKLASGGRKWTAIHGKISCKLRGAERRLYGVMEIIVELTPLLTPSEKRDIEQQLWRGTFGAIVYERFRVASVHSFGPPDGTTFDNMEFQGCPVPAIDFRMVHDALKRIIIVAKNLSERSGKWFGHDYE
jgi:hypothetical protein